MSLTKVRIVKDVAMPNEVYLATHDGLTTMVSARAATRVLEDTLRSAGSTPDTITSREMREMLLGPILQEFEGILPREGLLRNLRDLASHLKRIDRIAPPPAAAPEAASPAPVAHGRFKLEEEDVVVAEDFLLPSSPGAPGLPGTRSARATAVETLSVLELASPEVAASSDPGPAGGAAPEQHEDEGMDWVDVILLDEPREPLAIPPLLPGEEYGVQALERAVLYFARLDHVHMVAAVRGDGRVAAARGSGFDLDALSRLGISGLRLLSRNGQLRSYYLAHDLGQLFLFPLGRDTILVVGGPELNLGAVFSARASLKEEL